MGVFLPILKEIQTSRDIVQEFRGYNHNPRIPHNDFYDMYNMSSSHYPLLAPRQKRRRVRILKKPNGLYAHEKLCWVDGTDFYYDGEIKGSVTDGQKQFVGMGAYVLIFPDKVFYNSTTDEFGSLEASNTTSGTVTAALCTRDGGTYEYEVSDIAPEEPTNGQYWIDTSSTPHVLKQYSSDSMSWVSVVTTYVKISAPGIGVGLSELDGVTISGMENEALNGNFILYGVADNSIIVAAIVDTSISQQAAATVERKVPDMDYVTQSENRVWGCSSENHEIYACALGDPKNWNQFLGIATDSYAVTIGSSGDFTGCVTHLGYVIFFKEDVIHKIYGNKPANFQITNTNCRGVEKGSEKSIVIVNETLYYKSRHDVCLYGASLPESISAALGNDLYYAAAAGAYRSKYYISMVNRATNEPAMFVFDGSKGLWHKEDDTRATAFAAYGDDLYFIADDAIYSVNGKSSEYDEETAQDEQQVEWHAQTGDIGLEYPDAKYISKLQLRLEVSDRSLVCIEVQYDQERAWREECRINSTYKRSFTIPIIPRRCDTMRIRISGRGDCRVYSLTKTIEQGSEL